MCLLENLINNHKTRTQLQLPLPVCHSAAGPVRKYFMNSPELPTAMNDSISIDELFLLNSVENGDILMNPAEALHSLLISW